MIFNKLIVILAICIGSIMKSLNWIKSIILKLFGWLKSIIVKILGWLLPIAMRSKQMRRLKKRFAAKKSIKKPRVKKRKNHQWLMNVYLKLREYKYLDLFMLAVRVYSRRGKKIRFYEINGFREFCNQKHMKYMVIENRKVRTVCIPAYWDKTSQQCETFTSQETYIAELRQATIMGPTNAVIVKSQFLNDLLFYDETERIDIRDGYIRKRMDNYVIIEENDSLNRCECAINLVGAASYNYYHMLVEILPKLIIADKNSEYRKLPILVDEVVLRIPQYREVLSKVNIYNHPIIKVEVGEKWKVEKLVYVSLNTWMPINLYDRDALKPSDFMISELYLHDMRERVLSQISCQDFMSGEKKRYFISRKNITSTVRLKNEADIRDLFYSYGFEIMYPEELTFAEQVEHFSRAEYIVAASGAALANIIFCSPGTKIVCIIPQEFNFQMYSTIAYIFNLQPIFLDCRVVERTFYPSTDGYELDMAYARDFIERYIENGK